MSEKSAILKSCIKPMRVMDEASGRRIARAAIGGSMDENPTFRSPDYWPAFPRRWPNHIRDLLPHPRQPVQQTAARQNNESRLSARPPKLVGGFLGFTDQSATNQQFAAMDHAHKKKKTG